jgi:hypothetical protein
MEAITRGAQRNNDPAACSAHACCRYPGKYAGKARERLAALFAQKQQGDAQQQQPNVVVVNPNQQQPQQQLAAQAVQPAAGAAGAQPGFTSLGGSGVSIATSTPLSLSNPIELDIPSFTKDDTIVSGGLGGLLGGMFGRRRLQQQQGAGIGDW